MSDHFSRCALEQAKPYIGPVLRESLEGVNRPSEGDCGYDVLIPMLGRHVIERPSRVLYCLELSIHVSQKNWAIRIQANVSPASIT